MYSNNDIGRYNGKKRLDKPLKDEDVTLFHQIVSLINECSQANFICIGAPHLSFWGDHHSPSQWKQGDAMMKILKSSKMQFVDPHKMFETMPKIVKGKTQFEACTS